jgi:hypothetical protein
MSIKAVDAQLRAQLQAGTDIGTSIEAVITSGDSDGLRKVGTKGLRARAEIIQSAIDSRDAAARRAEQRDAPEQIGGRDVVVRDVGFYAEGFGFCQWNTATPEQLEAREQALMRQAGLPMDGDRRKRKKSS